MFLQDPIIREGIEILIVGIIIVFTALLMLFLVFQFVLPRILKLINKRKKYREITLESVTPQVQSGEEMAAISAAIHLYLEETHDREVGILTIGKTDRNYSPWSSKIYTTYNLLNKR